MPEDGTRERVMLWRRGFMWVANREPPPAYVADSGDWIGA